MTTPAARPPLTKAQRTLAAVVVGCVATIAAIGFAGSYTAVQELAEEKGFGRFSFVFPIGIDAGIFALLALDLLLAWLRMPFPLLRQTAWLLTAATIAFNGAAAWPDPLGVGMHSAIPLLFVIAVEAARHAIGRIADITADRHMESVRLIRWLLAFPSTFRLWRRMKLWELRSYDEAIRLEQDLRLYQDELRSKYGRRWRSKATTGELRPLRLARYGKPITASTAAKTVICAGVSGALTIRQLAAPAPATGATNNPPVAAKKTASKPAKKPTTGDKNTTRPVAKKAARRSMEEWVELATPVFHDEFTRLRRQPSGPEFADAIGKAGLGDVSASTAKNIRTAILDHSPLPSID